MAANNMRQARIPAFGGINRRPGAVDGELAETYNTSTDNYPALSCRPGRERVGSWEDAEDVYLAGGKTFACSGGKLYMDGEELASVVPGTKQWALINSKLVVWPDKLMVDLNSGSCRAMEMSISGSTTISGDGTINTANSVNTKTLILAGQTKGIYKETMAGGSFDTTAKCWQYTTLEKTGSGWVPSPEEGTFAAPVEGRFFIGEDPSFSTWRVPPVSDLSLPRGRFIKAERKNYYTFDDYYSSGEGWDLHITYEVLDDIDLSMMIEAGDVLKMDGSKFLYHNRSFTVDEITEAGAIKASGFVYWAKYWNIDAEYASGVYSCDGVVYNVDRALHKGQQMFKIYGSEALAGTSGLQFGVLYVWDPQTEQLHAFYAGSGTAEHQLVLADDYRADQAEVLTIKREIPNMDYICSHNNRMYGVCNAEESTIWDTATKQYIKVYARTIHASELGYPMRWSSFKGTANDSYVVAVSGDGDFTGCCEYSNTAMFFKEDRVYRLTGDYPAEFYLRAYDMDGVKTGCAESLCVLNEVLYYLSPVGVMAYTGGTPSLASYNLGLTHYARATAGRCRMHYVISFRDYAGRSEIYRYDTIHKLWSRENFDTAQRIVRDGDRALILIGGKIWRTDVDEAAEDIPWYAELAEADEGTFAKKEYNQILLDAELAEDATLSLYYSADEDTEWHLLETTAEEGSGRWLRQTVLNGPQRKRWQFPMDNLRCDRLRLRLEGIGMSKVYGVERVYQLYSDRS